MKKAIILSLTAVLFFTASSFAQKAGEVDFGLSGNLFKSAKSKYSGSESFTAITPSVFVGYFMSKNFRLDAGFSVEKGNKDQFDFETQEYKLTYTPKKMGLPLLIGGRYFFGEQNKMRWNVGMDLTFAVGDGLKEFDDNGKSTAPISLNIPIEGQYWPMEGGAIIYGAFYNMHGLNLGKGGINRFGLNLGILIRLK